MIDTTCCEKLVAELDAWKDRANHIARELDKVPHQDKGDVLPKTMDLHVFIEELDERIGTLKSNCPEGWEPTDIGVTMLRTHKTGNWGKDWEYCGPWPPK